MPRFPDVARTFDGKLFRLETHLDRLFRSLAYTRIDCGLGREEVTAIGEETVARNPRCAWRTATKRCRW